MIWFKEFARAFKYTVENKTTLKTRYDSHGVLWYGVESFKTGSNQ